MGKKSLTLFYMCVFFVFLIITISLNSEGSPEKDEIFYHKSQSFSLLDVEIDILIDYDFDQINKLVKPGIEKREVPITISYRIPTDKISQKIGFTLLKISPFISLNISLENINQWTDITIFDTTIILPQISREWKTYNTSLFIMVSENAPGLQPMQFTVRVSNPVIVGIIDYFMDIQPVNETMNIQYMADFLPLLTPTTPNPITIINDITGKNKLHIKNSGNARELIEFSIIDYDYFLHEDEELNISIPSSIYLNTGESITIPYTVSYSPSTGGYHDDWFSITLKANVSSAYKHPFSTNNYQYYSIPITVHFLGYTEPSTDDIHTINIRGYIWDNQTGQPITNAKIFSQLPGFNSSDEYINHYIAYSNENGYYQFNISSFTNFYLYVRAPLYYATGTMNIPINRSYLWINFTLIPGRLPESSVIKGFITKHHSGLPISNATIMTVWWDNSTQKSDINVTQSDENGYYQLCVSPEGFRYMISYYTSFFNFTEYMIIEQKTTIWQNFSFPSSRKETSTLIGFLSDKQTHQPVSHATVSVLVEKEMMIPYFNTTTTDSQGFFIMNIPDGKATLSLSKPEYYTINDAMVIEHNTIKSYINSLESIDFYEKTYRIEWSKKTRKIQIGNDLFADRSTSYNEDLLISSPHASILTRIMVNIIWEDDYGYGFVFKKGQDILTAEIGYHNNWKTLTTEGSGNESLSFSINSIPVNDLISAISLGEAEQMIESFISGNNQADLNVCIDVDPGEPFFRFLKYLKDRGNDFEINVEYDYYIYTIEEKGK